MSATVSTSTTIQLQGTVTVAELQSILEALPGSGQVRFQTYAGDQRDPAYTTLTVTHR